MDVTIYPGTLSGTLKVIPSKSQAHRILICAAFADKETEIICPRGGDDLTATVQCLCALGAEITTHERGYWVKPAKQIPGSATLFCGQSGSTLRFLLPVVGALGVDATFYMEGRLPSRPLTPLWQLMEHFGCTLTRPTAATLRCQGQLQPGEHTIDGSVSSQFITGLMIAQALIRGNCTLTCTGAAVSKPYIEMTASVLRSFGVSEYSKILISSGKYCVEGDWSNGAFFMAANSLGSRITVEGLDLHSVQGDAIFPSLACKLKQEFSVIDAADIPDLVPILSVLAVCHHGAKFTNINRLRTKESDRVASVCHMLTSLGADAAADENTITVRSGKLLCGTVDAYGDHRIAMAAAIAATVAHGAVTILGAQCVSKSYPSFWEEFCRLGGKYEQYLR